MSILHTAPKKRQLIAEWEQNTGNVWPTSLHIDKKTGELKPVNHQFHHIIPQEFGGPNAWWNGHPLKGGAAHQGGVHGSGSPLNIITKDIGKLLKNITI